MGFFLFPGTVSSDKGPVAAVDLLLLWLGCDTESDECGGIEDAGERGPAGVPSCKHGEGREEISL